jgi:cytoskeletal protein CcmA (bactofilin family)
MADQAFDKNTEGAVFIGAGVEFKGNMTVPGSVSVDGKFEGTLKAKNLIVGQSGRVSGQISVETADIRGAVDDNLVVETKLALRGTGSVSGSVSYSNIVVEEGGELSGTIEKISSDAAKTRSDGKVLQLQRSGED